MNINLIVAIIAAVAFIIVFLVTIIYQYVSIVKNKKTYSRQKSLNGDIYLDDVCEKYLSLTNLHVPNSD